MKNITIRPFRLIFCWSLIGILGFKFGFIAAFIGFLLSIDAELN
jgi:hypothetical protein